MILRILRAAAIAVLVWAFVSGLLVFGATRTPDLLRLFVLTGIPTAVALAGLFGRRAFQSSSIPWILALGAFLFWKAGSSGAVEGRGYVLLALGWMAFFLTLSIAGRGARASRWFFFGLVAVGVLEALYGLAQAVGGFDYIGDYHRGMGRVATGTLFNRNHFAGLLNLLVPLALGSVLAKRATAGPLRGPDSEDLAAGWIVVMGSSLMGLAVLLSQSRAGTVSLLFCLLLTAVLLHAKRRERSLTAFAPWLILLLVAGLGLGVGLQSLITKFESSGSGLMGRATIYMDTLNLITDHPVTGVGPGMYAWRFRPYQTVSAGVWFDYAHNDYLQTAAEWGLAPALLFWGWVGWRLLRSVRVFFRSRNGWFQGLSLGCAVSIFSILLHSMVDFNLYIPTTWMVFCSVLGLSLAVERLEAEAAPRGEGEGPW